MESILERLVVKPTIINKKQDFDIKIGYLDETSKYKDFDINIVKKNLQDVRRIIPEENIETEQIVYAREQEPNIGLNKQERAEEKEAEKATKKAAKSKKKMTNSKINYLMQNMRMAVCELG